MITKNQFILLYEKQHGKCAYCCCSLLDEAKSGRGITTDHIIAKNNNGGDKDDNLCLTCRWCNVVKRDKSKEKFLEFLQPYFDGKVGKKELAEYHRYLKLKDKFLTVK